MSKGVLIIPQELRELWVLDENERLYLKCKFNNFASAMTFANEVALIADEHNHHPDLSISWSSCEIWLWTHNQNKVTLKDINLALAINKLLLI